MLDVLSEGRLEYGIGRGFLNYSYQIFGIDPEQSLAGCGKNGGRGEISL